MPHILGIPPPDCKETPPKNENLLGVGAGNFKIEDLILIGLFFFLYQEKEKNAELLISLAILFFLGLK